MKWRTKNAGHTNVLYAKTILCLIKKCVRKKRREGSSLVDYDLRRVGWGFGCRWLNV